MSPSSPPASPASSVDPLEGVVLDGRYVLQKLIARGAMGAVYEAEQILLNRRVAVKVMDPQHLHESLEKFAERFRREASVLARLQHPNIVRVYDYGRYGEAPFLVMEHIDGYSLQRLQAGGPIPPSRLVPIAMQMCDALEEAHALDLIHRDLKPANILLTRHAGVLDVVKVVDFGLAKDLVSMDPEVTDVGQVMGTPMYMAPEQIRDDACDGRTDIYALGILMYRSLTGVLPFKAGQTTAVLLANLQERPPAFAEVNPNLKVSAELERVVFQCLEKDPDRRFPSVRVLREALKRFDLEEDGPSHGHRSSGASAQPSSDEVTAVRSLAVRRLLEDLPPPEPSRRSAGGPWLSRAPTWTILLVLLVIALVSAALGAGVVLSMAP